MLYDPTLNRLCAAFPACFSRTAPKPLKIGLGEELLALAGVHPVLADLSRTQLRRALKVYTGSPAYRKALAQRRPALRSGRASGRRGHAGTAGRRQKAPPETARAGTQRAGIARDPGNGLCQNDAETAALKKSGRAISRGMVRP